MTRSLTHPMKQLLFEEAAKKQILQVLDGHRTLFLPVGAKTCFGGEAPMQQGRQECRPSDGPATLLSPMVATKACFAPPTTHPLALP